MPYLYRRILEGRINIGGLWLANLTALTWLWLVTYNCGAPCMERNYFTTLQYYLVLSNVFIQSDSEWMHLDAIKSREGKDVHNQYVGMATHQCPLNMPLDSGGHVGLSWLVREHRSSSPTEIS